PFTTLVPNLGVAPIDAGTTLVLADIPGLIEGAHNGAGLGYEFLRHIQRTRVLVHILDGAAADPLADFSQTNSELALFDEQLTKRPMIVAVNKIDLPEVLERWPALQAELQRRGYEVFGMSALLRRGTREVLYRAAQLVAETPVPAPVTETPIYKP